MPRRYTMLTDLQREAVVILGRYMSTTEVAACFGVSDMTVARIGKEAAVAQRVWMRRGDSLEPPAGPPPAPANDEAFVQPSPVQIVEVSLMRAMEALRRGDSAEAIRLTEAGGKVGEFAELVKLVRARAGGESPGICGDG